MTADSITELMVAMRRAPSSEPANSQLRRPMAVPRKDLSAPPCDAYFHRRTDKVNRERWFPMFKGDSKFVERWKIDATRPQVLKPHPWHHGVSIEEGLRRAK